MAATTSAGLRNLSWMDRKVFFTTIKKVLMRADINTTTGQAATMDYFDGTN